MCGLIDSFHMQHCQCQARSSLSHIIQSLGQTIQILVIMDKQFACHRFPATKASTASPKRCCVPLVQPPATGITIFHSAQPQVAMAPSQRPWRLSPSTSVSLTAPSSPPLPLPPTDCTVTASHFFTHPTSASYCSAPLLDNSSNV